MIQVPQAGLGDQVNGIVCVKSFTHVTSARFKLSPRKADQKRVKCEENFN